MMRGSDETELFKKRLKVVGIGTIQAAFKICEICVKY